MEPVLYISYGMGKSGSTLAFNLVRELLLAADIPQPSLPGANEGNFVSRFEPDTVASLRGAAEAISASVGTRPIVLKTHWSPQSMSRGLAEGWAIGHAVCRDPRDIALSLVDAARKGLGWGGKGFDDPSQTIQVIERNIRRFESWVIEPGVIPIRYEELAFDTETVARRIADQLGLSVNIRRAVKTARKHKNQFNIGRSQRWKTEMAPWLANRFAERFEDFIEQWCGDGADPPRKGLGSRILGR